MAVNPFENMFGGGGAYGGGSPFQQYNPPVNQPMTNTGTGRNQNTYGGDDMNRTGRGSANAGTTSTTNVTYNQPPWAQQGYPAWRNQFTRLGGSPYTYTQPQNPWMQQQQQGPWGMANRGVNPYAGPNTADPRFQPPGMGMWGGGGNSWQYGAPGMPQWGPSYTGTNPMWQSLMQQRYLPSQNPYAPMRPNPNYNFWLPGMNPYATQSATTQAPTTGQGLQRGNSGRSYTG